MEKRFSTDQKLQILIESLESKMKTQEEDLRFEWGKLMESLKPGNLIKSAAHDIFSNPKTRRTAISAGVGVAAVAVTRNILMKKLGEVTGNAMTSLFQFVGKKLKRKK